MSLPEFPIGNAFPFQMNLQIKNLAGDTVPVGTLASALDIVVQVGKKPSQPTLTLSLVNEPAQVAVDNPATGSVTFTVFSTDSIGMEKGKQFASIQVKYGPGETNNVEWPAVEVFNLLENNVPPVS